MALQHLRSNTASKRPTPASMADGQLAINTNATSAGLFFKDAAGALVKVGPVHVGTSAPNSSPAGSSGNAIGEQWLDTSGGGYVLKIWDGSEWRSEAGEFVDAAGDTMTGDLVMNNANIVFEGSTDDGFETTLTVTDPTADRTITLPNVTGTVVTTGDTGTVTSTMITDGTIVNADINASAAIALSKLATGALPTAITVASANIVDGTIVNADINASAAIAGTKIDPDFGSQTIETTGLFSAAGGSAAAPSITFTGDTNTGIYSPGTDQVALSTNGTGRLFVDASGNVGVGIASPVAGRKLHVSGVGTLAQFDSSNASCLLKFTNSSASLGFMGYEGDNLTFYTTNTERLRITSAGLVGIGTSSPQAALHTNGAILSSGTLAALSASNIFFDQPTSALSRIGVVGANTSTTGTLRISQYSSDGSTGRDVLSISSAGNVGIGTTSPIRPLSVSNGGAEGFEFGPGDTAGTNLTLHYNRSTSAYIGSINQANYHTWSAGGASEKMRIDSSGRLLVGTSSTSVTTTQILQGNSGAAAGNGKLIFARGTTSPADGSGLGEIAFSDSSHGSSVTILAARDGGTWTSGSSQPSRLVFSTTADGASTPTERMRIDSSGYVSINATQNFPGDNNTGTGIFLERAADGGTIFGSRAGGKSGSFNRNANGEVIRFNRSGVDVGSIDVTTSATSYNTSSDYRLKENIVLLTGATDRLNQLQVYRFNFIADPGATVDGFIAHEAQAVVPECVTGTKDEVDEDGNPVYQGIDQSKMVPLVVAALQECIKKVEALEAEVAALKAS